MSTVITRSRIMKNKLRVGDYLARKKTHQGDNGERFEVISISEDSVRVLNLKNAWEILELSWDNLENNFCGEENIKDKMHSIENVVKKIQKSLKIKEFDGAKIDLGKIEAVIFPIYEDLLKLIVFERKTWAGEIKTSSYNLPSDINDLKEAYPILSKNIWDFSKSEGEEAL